MSARSATTGPGQRALEQADDAGVGDAGAHLVEAERAQVLGDELAVRNSRLPSSGCAWKSRRQATTLGATRAACASRSGAPARVSGAFIACSLPAPRML